MGKAVRYYEEEFKRQIVELHLSGKSVIELHNVYNTRKMTL